MPSFPNRKFPFLIVVGLGILLCLLMGYVRHLSFEFVLDDPNTKARPLLECIGLFAVAFVVYLSACYILVFREDSRAVEKDDIVSRRWGWSLCLVVFLFGLIARALLVFSSPIQEVDLYRYILDGVTVAEGFDPFTTPPQKIVDAQSPQLPGQLMEKEIPTAEQIRLAEMVTLRPGLQEALRHVHFKQYSTPYPPVSQAVFGAAMWFVPPEASMDSYLYSMKAVLVGFDVATAVLIVLMLTYSGLPSYWVVAYFWCPLVLKEFANSGHLDSIVVFCATLAIYFLTRAFWANHSRSQTEDLDDERESLDLSKPNFGFLFGSALALALSIAAKIFPVVWIPLWIVVCFRKSSWLTTLVAGAALFVFTLTLMWPMARHFQITQKLGHAIAPTVFGEPQEGAVDTGLEAFAKYWEMNDLLFMVVVENLKTSETLAEGQEEAWFVVLSNETRKKILETIPGASEQPEPYRAFWVTRRLMAIVFLFVVAGCCIYFWKSPDLRSLLNAAFLVTAWFWLLSPTQNPWYWAWAMPLLVFCRSRTWFLVSGVALAYYFRFYCEYHLSDQEVLGTGLMGTLFFDFFVPWLEFVPILVLLLCEWLIRKRVNIIE